MNFDIAVLLAQDGLTNGAIYALVGISLVLVFAVTRVLFVPQGDFAVLGALTLAMLQQGQVPGTVWLLLCLGGVAFLMDTAEAVRRRSLRLLAVPAAVYVALPAVLVALSLWLAPLKAPLPVQVLLTLALVVPLGPIVYRVAFQPLASASILVLLFVAVAVHYILMGLGLLFFGPEGWRTPAFITANFPVGPMLVSGQSLLVMGASVALIVVFWQFFGRSLWGKALRATALNRVGARLVGIPTEAAGRLTFTVMALLGAFSGILIAPFTTLYYDSGFLIALKGFVGAVIGGMASYPVAAAGAVFVGLLEAFASFYASALKEVIVFSLLVPVLLWLSVTTHHAEPEHDE